MGLYQNNAGNLSLISGRGKAEYGASTMRTGTVNMTGNAGTGVWFSATVTFSEPMPDTNYLINLEVTNNAAYCLENIQFSNKTVNGFTMAAYHPTSTTATSISVKYTAYKLYSDIEYKNLIKRTVGTGTATSQTNYTFNGSTGIQYTRVGNVCTLYIQLNCTTGASYEVAVMTGLPKADQVAMNTHFWAHRWDNFNADPIGLYVNGAGTLYVKGGAASSGPYVVTFTYICKD